MNRGKATGNAEGLKDIEKGEKDQKNIFWTKVAG